MNGKRGLALVAGGLLLVLLRAWTWEQWTRTPFFGYGFTYFRNSGPGEWGFLLRFFLAGTPAALLIAWGSAPWLSRRLTSLSLASRSYSTLRLALMFLAMILTTVVAYAVLRGSVVTDDEYVYLFQARMLAQGRAAFPAPPLADFLGNVFVAVHEGRWFGQYPPGHPLALVPGVLVGIPRLVPIVLTGLNLWLSIGVLERIAGRGWALVGGLSLLFSPLFLLTGATLLSHSTAYLGLALAAGGLLRLVEKDSALAGLAAGSGLGLLFITRPYSGATLGGVLGLALLWVLFRHGRRRAQTPAILAVALLGGCFLLYNLGATGDPLVTGYAAVRDPGHVELGFGTIAEGVAPHTPAQGLRNVGILALRFQAWALGWPLALLLPLLALIRLPVAVGMTAPDKGNGASSTERRRPPARKTAVFAAVLVAAGLVSYIAYWSLGVNDTGPVKTYELLLPLIVLTVLGGRAAAGSRGPGVVGGWFLGSIMVGMVAFWPPMIQHLRNLTAGIGYPLQMVESTVETPALVFVQAVQPRPPRSWVYGRPNPDPRLTDPILYVRDGGPMNAAYWKLHPGRTAYRLEFTGQEPRLTPLERLP